MREVPGLARYQIIQEAIDRFRVRLQPYVNDQHRAGADGVREAIRKVVGEHANVDIEWSADLDPPPGRKFRLVECRI